MTGADSNSPTGARPGWFTHERYGGSASIAASLAAFGALSCFTVYTIMMASYLVSTSCIGDNGQLPICPASGPDWARPLPAAAALVSLLAGLAGVAVGRPIRTPALVSGFVLTAAGLAVSRLMLPA